MDGVWLAFTETRPAKVSGGCSSSSSSRSSNCRQGGSLGFLLPDIESNDGAVFISVETRALVFSPKVGDLISESLQFQVYIPLNSGVHTPELFLHNNPQVCVHRNISLSFDLCAAPQ